MSVDLKYDVLSCKCYCRVYPLESGEVKAWKYVLVGGALCGNPT